MQKLGFFKKRFRKSKTDLSNLNYICYNLIQYTDEVKTLNDKKFLLISVLNKLKNSLDLSNFTNRLLIQKKVFFLQYCGVPLNFDFGWYARGPYSRDLTRAVFEIESIYNDEEKRKDLLLDLKGYEEKIAKAKKLIEFVNSLGENSEDWYELTASLLFLKKYGYPKPKSDDELFNMLSQRKPRFRIENIKLVNEKIKDFWK